MQDSTKEVAVLISLYARALLAVGHGEVDVVFLDNGLGFQGIKLAVR